jgi:hypothetical protein
VIVGIGSEHLAALGGSLESIARAKAGIIKQSRPVCYCLIVYFLGFFNFNFNFFIQLLFHQVFLS